MFTPTVCKGSVFFASSPTLAIYGCCDSRFYKRETICHCGLVCISLGFPGGSVIKNIPADAAVTGSVPGLGRCPGEGNGKPFQDSCWENPMVRGASQTLVLGVTKSQTGRSDWVCTIMATFNIFSCVRSTHVPVGTTGKEPTCQCRRHRDTGLIRKILWRRAWQPTPVLLPGESHGPRSLVGAVHGVAKSQTRLKQLST